MSKEGWESGEGRNIKTAISDIRSPVRLAFHLPRLDLSRDEVGFSIPVYTKYLTSL